jgi:L-fuconolactonase
MRVIDVQVHAYERIIPAALGLGWEPVLRIIDAFGLDRCMWGTGWARTSGMVTYEQGVRPFVETTRLSEGDKAKLMGGTLEKVYRW